MMTINNVSMNPMSVTSNTAVSSAETKALQTQLAGEQQRLNKLTSDAEMTTAEKEKERRQIRQGIAELNRELRQKRTEEKEQAKENAKEQEKKKIIKESLLEEADTKAREESDKADKTVSSEDNLPVVTLTKVISATSDIRQANIEEQSSRKSEQRQSILATEIQSDELYGTDTSSKKEELSKMREAENFLIKAIHKKDDTSMEDISIPTMDLNTKIIIRE